MTFNSSVAGMRDWLEGGCGMKQRHQRELSKCCF